MAPLRLCKGCLEILKIVYGKFYVLFSQSGEGGKGWLGFPDLWSGQNPRWNWYLTPACGEFRWSPEGTVSHSGPLGSFRSFKVYSDAKERVGCEKQREATAPVQSLVKLQPCLPSLRWKTCLRQNCSLDSCACSEEPALGKNTLMIMMIYNI